MRFKKAPLLEMGLSLAAIFLSIAAFVVLMISAKVQGESYGYETFAIFSLVLSVLLFAALSTKKVVFTRIVFIIVISAVVLETFINAIVCSSSFQSATLGWDTVAFLCLSILELAASILFFVYFLINRKGNFSMLSRLLNFFAIAFHCLLAVAVIVSSFAGMFATKPMSGIGLAILLIIVSLLLLTANVFQKNLEYKKEEKAKESEQEGE